MLGQASEPSAFPKEARKLLKVWQEVCAEDEDQGSRSDLSEIAKAHSWAFCLTFPDRVLKIITLSAHVFIK